MAIQKTEAFVLRSQPFRTSSLVVTTFSRSLGKVKGIAKGVRREGIPHPSTFEPFTLLELIFYEKIRSDLHLISEANVLESFESLRSDLETLATAYYLVELVDQLTPPHDRHEPIFELLHFAFEWLPSLSPPFLTRFFEIRLLREVGLLPHLGGCLGCGVKDPDKAYFSVKQGAIFCPVCRRQAPESRLLSLDVLRAMRGLLAIKGEASFSGLEEVLAPSVEREMGGIVERFLTERLGRRLLTRRFLSQVRSLKLSQRARL